MSCIMEMCRACLLTGNNMISLNEFYVNNYNLLTNLNVTLCDGMPQHLCQNCTEVINCFIDFRNKSISSETTLKEVAKNIKPDDEDVHLENKQTIEEKPSLKLEIKCEISDEPKVIDEVFSDHFDEDYFHFDDKEDVIDSSKSVDIKCEKIKNKPKRKRIKYKEEETLNHSFIEDIKPKNEKKSRGKHVIKKSKSFLSCGLCKKKFEDHDALNAHLESHKKYTQCEICSESFTSWQQMFGHRLQHLPVAEQKCHICFKNRFFVCANLEFHYLTKHSSEVKDASLTCKACLKSFSNPIKLKRHNASMHAVKKIYICDYCSKRFTAKSNLKTHIASHSNVKRYKCKLCVFSCKVSSGLADHTIRKHAPDKATCRKCKRIFVDKMALDKHNCNVKQFVCPICGKNINASTGSRLNRHLETHEPVGRYKCDRCPTTYRTKEALRVHKNRHDGNRTYGCETCPAKFYSYPSLIKHRRTHTGEKPYVCNICSKAFMCNSNLKTHMKVHGLFLINHKNKDIEKATQN